MSAVSAVDRLVAPASVRAERLDRVEREPRREDPEVLEQLPLRASGSRLDAPVDRRPHRAVPLGQIADGRRQQRQAALEALGDAARGQDPHLRRGELDRQRQPFEPPADVGQVAPRCRR